MLDTPGRVNISCSAIPKLYDRGEGRVQAYSGNPVKDFQVGELTGRMTGMALSVTKQMGRKFSLFRYQHHNLPWNSEYPDSLDMSEVGYLDQWLSTANTSADKVMIDFQISPFIRAYKVYSKMGTRSLPEAGVPGFTWDKLRLGYVTVLRHAKKLCPQLCIVQMPYELDNIADTECLQDAHYQLFKVVYQAVNEVNRELPPDQQLKVAGLGGNNPRWNFVDGFLQHYAADTNVEKRLDYLTWHAYVFPGDNPNAPKGFNAKLQIMLEKYKLSRELPVIVDEAGLAETTTIDDISDLLGAARKESAMACLNATIQYWYLKEGGNFIPITGAGWHFSLLTYGKQNVISPLAKGMILRSRLEDGMISSTATPCDTNGFGLYSLATKNDSKISVLIWSASPAILYQNASPLRFPKAEVSFNDLPSSFQSGRVKVTIQSSAPNQEATQHILSADKCQTVPLTRGADRYDVDFTQMEVNELNAIPTKTFFLVPKDKSLTVPLNVDEYGMYLITIEKEE